MDGESEPADAVLMEPLDDVAPSDRSRDGESHCPSAVGRHVAILKSMGQSITDTSA